jgi:cytochrome c553
MKTGGLKVAVTAAALTILIPAAAHAAGIEEKLGYCRNCHGDCFQGFSAYFTAARLAGQQEQYLLNQFNSLRKHVRDDPVAQRFMYPVVSHGTPDLWPAIAKYLSTLDAPPAADGPRHLVEAGRKIYEEGVPEANVPACAACHGPEAHGQDQIPRLAGQLYAYMLDELTDWQQGYRAKDPADPSNENIMVPIAKALSKEHTKEVAAYLSYQK